MTSSHAADATLAKLALKRGDLKKAEEMWEEIVRRYRQAENGSYSHIWALFSFAEVKLALGKGKEAESLFGQALGRGRTEWGADALRLRSWSKRLARLAPPLAGNDPKRGWDEQVNSNPVRLEVGTARRHGVDETKWVND